MSMTKAELIAALVALPCDDATPIEVGVFVGDCGDPALANIVSVTIDGTDTQWAGCSTPGAPSIVLATY